MMQFVQVAVNTTRIDTWDGPIDQIGPMYPFVGWEWLALIIAVGIVLYWFVAVYLLERRVYKEDVDEYGDVLSMTKIVKGDHYSLSRTDIPKDVAEDLLKDSSKDVPKQ
jgi:hypothetical protein